MTTVIKRVVSYVCMTVFGSFILYLLQPKFPNASNWLKELSKKIMNVLPVPLDEWIISVLLVLIVFIVLYEIVNIVFSRRRKKRVEQWRSTGELVHYQNSAYSLVKIIVSIVLLPLIYAFGKVFLNIFTRTDFRENRVFLFCASAVLSLIIWVAFAIAKKKEFDFLRIFEHEMTHMLLGMLFFHPPMALSVDREEGGWVKLAGGNFVITLGPYFFPTACVFLLPVYPFIKPAYYTYFALAMGFAFSYQLVSTAIETNFKIQPDILLNGRLFSALVIVFGNILCLGFILSFVINGFAGGTSFIVNGWQELIHLIPKIG
jgi:hypothetical protein